MTAWSRHTYSWREAGGREWRGRCSPERMPLRANVSLVDIWSLPFAILKRLREQQPRELTERDQNTSGSGSSSRAPATTRRYRTSAGEERVKRHRDRIGSGEFHRCRQGSVGISHKVSLREQTKQTFKAFNRGLSRLSSSGIDHRTEC